MPNRPATGARNDRFYSTRRSRRFGKRGALRRAALSERGYRRPAGAGATPAAKSPGAVDGAAENEVGTVALDADYSNKRTSYRGTTTVKGADTMAWAVESESGSTAASRRRPADPGFAA